MTFCSATIRNMLGAAIFAALGLVVVAPVAADPFPAMNGSGWLSRRTSDGINFVCTVSACGGEAFVGFSRWQGHGDTEKELRSRSVDARAFLGSVLVDGDGFDLPNASKRISKDYAAVQTSGTYRGAPFAAIIIAQGRTMYLVTSTAQSAQLANSNLAKALASLNLRRAH